MTTAGLARRRPARGAARMEAAVLEGPRRLRLVEVARPEPAAGEVRVRIEGCGVCGSNLGPWLGLPGAGYPMEPGAPGHEGWGRVDAVGPGVSEDLQERRVALLSYRAFAAFDVAPAHAVVGLPPELDGAAVPAEPLACAVNVFRRSGIAAGAVVAVVGVGFLGALLVRLAAAAGARVLAISRRPYALDVARRMGAAEAIPLEDGDVTPRISDLTDGELCDVVVEAAGRQATLDVAAELVRVRGRLVVAGYHQDGPRTVNLQSWNWRGIDVVNAHERDPQTYVSGMREAVAAAARGDLRVEPLLTHTFPLRGLGEALDATRERPDGFLKAVVTP